MSAARSGSLPYLSAVDIRSMVSMAEATDLLTSAFATRPPHAARLSIAVAGGDFLVMPAVTAESAGAKLLMVQPANTLRNTPVIQGVYVLFDATSGSPVALLDGAALTSLRTPAVSAIATNALAVAAPRTLVVFGRGPQALGHIEAIREVRPSITDVITITRDTPGTAAAAAVANAQIICTCTSSATPVLFGDDVAPGSHINLVGSYQPAVAEADPALIARARVFVDEISAARHEAGDLIRAHAIGQFEWAAIAGDLADLSSGHVTRQSPTEITVFKSVGLAFEDLVIAEHVARRAGVW
jgi:ornithine cyclodeaminase/alanine dehydrogenase-like protein (mu-crystallin family)